MFRRSLLTLALAAVAGLSGCATYYSVPLRTHPAQPAVPALSVGELLQMLQAGRPQADIIADVRGRGLRVPPAPADLDVLAAAGAGPELLQTLQSVAAPPGAVAQAGTVIVQEPTTVYHDVYPLIPFSLGLGLGFYSGSGYWGSPYYRGYAPVRPYIWGGAPRVSPPPVHIPGSPFAPRPAMPRGGFLFKPRR